MSTLREYLEQKRAALLARREKAKNEPLAPHTISARVRAEGRSGVRRIRIRDFQVISDSGPDFAGYDLGPSSPELQLGVLGSCLTHVFLIQAADLEVPLDSLEVEVTAVMDPRAGRPGFEHVPVYPHEIAYVVNLESPASAERIADCTPRSSKPARFSTSCSIHSRFVASCSTSARASPHWPAPSLRRGKTNRAAMLVMSNKRKESETDGHPAGESVDVRLGSGRGETDSVWGSVPSVPRMPTLAGPGCWQRFSCVPECGWEGGTGPRINRIWYQGTGAGRWFLHVGGKRVPDSARLSKVIHLEEWGDLEGDCVYTENC